jgi:hypothetical protein
MNVRGDHLIIMKQREFGKGRKRTRLREGSKGGREGGMNEEVEGKDTKNNNYWTVTLFFFLGTEQLTVPMHPCDAVMSCLANGVWCSPNLERRNRE